MTQSEPVLTASLNDPATVRELRDSIIRYVGSYDSDYSRRGIEWGVDRAFAEVGAKLVQSPVQPVPDRECPCRDCQSRPKEQRGRVPVQPVLSGLDALEVSQSVDQQVRGRVEVNRDALLRLATAPAADEDLKSARPPKPPAPGPNREMA